MIAAQGLLYCASHRRLDKPVAAKSAMVRKAAGGISVSWRALGVSWCAVVASWRALGVSLTASGFEGGIGRAARLKGRRNVDFANVKGNVKI